MTLEQLHEVYSNGNVFEKETGLSHVNWHNWNRWGYIPIHSQLRLERITKGVLKASLEDIPTRIKE